MRDGEAVVVYADGARYEGGFVRGTREGEGRLTHAGRLRLRGRRSAAGSSTGRARRPIPDGSTYEGEFVDGQRQGEGTMRLADGREIDGLWEAGQPVGAATRGARRPGRAGGAGLRRHCARRWLSY